jgi:RNA recognition motif-containing protein
MVPIRTNALYFERQTTMNIYVGNLPYSVTDADLRATFAEFGDVAEVNLISDRYTGESKGFGFVEMQNNSEADAAIKGLNGTDMKGRTITVNQARPKSDRPNRGRRF